MSAEDSTESPKVRQAVSTMSAWQVKLATPVVAMMINTMILTRHAVYFVECWTLYRTRSHSILSRARGPIWSGTWCSFSACVSQRCLCYLAATDDAERQNIKCTFQNRDNSPGLPTTNPVSLCKEQLEASTARSERRNVHQLGLMQSQEAAYALPRQLEVARWPNSTGSLGSAKLGTKHGKGGSRDLQKKIRTTLSHNHILKRKLRHPYPWCFLRLYLGKASAFHGTGSSEGEDPARFTLFPNSAAFATLMSLESLHIFIFFLSQVMLRNLPNNYTREMLLALLDKHGLGRLHYCWYKVDIPELFSRQIYLHFWCLVLFYCCSVTTTVQQMDDIAWVRRWVLWLCVFALRLQARCESGLCIRQLGGHWGLMGPNRREAHKISQTTGDLLRYDWP